MGSWLGPIKIRKGGDKIQQKISALHIMFMSYLSRAPPSEFFSIVSEVVELSEIKK